MPADTRELGPLTANGATDWVSVREGAYALIVGVTDGGVAHYDFDGGSASLEFSDTKTEAGSRTVRISGTDYTTSSLDAVAIYLPGGFVRLRLSGAGGSANLAARLDFGVTRDQKN